MAKRVVVEERLVESIDEHGSRRRARADTALRPTGRCETFGRTPRGAAVTPYAAPSSVAELRQGSSRVRVVRRRDRRRASASASGTPPRSRLLADERAGRSVSLGRSRRRDAHLVAGLEQLRAADGRIDDAGIDTRRLVVVLGRVVERRCSARRWSRRWRSSAAGRRLGLARRALRSAAGASGKGMGKRVQVVESQRRLRRARPRTRRRYSRRAAEEPGGVDDVERAELRYDDANNVEPEARHVG